MLDPGCSFSVLGSGDSSVVERRTGYRRVSGSTPCWSCGRIFFSMVNFLCWFLFRDPFHSRVTVVALKRSRSFCQKWRWQVKAKHACTLHMWLWIKRHCKLVHGYMRHTEPARTHTHIHTRSHTHTHTHTHTHWQREAGVMVVVVVKEENRGKRRVHNHTKNKQTRSTTNISGLKIVHTLLKTE